MPYNVSSRTLEATRHTLVEVAVAAGGELHFGAGTAVVLGRSEETLFANPWTPGSTLSPALPVGLYMDVTFFEALSLHMRLAQPAPNDWCLASVELLWNLFNT